MAGKSLYWADQIAREIIAERGKKELYVCAAGITPSGTVHIGNFREVITVDLVARALKSAGKKVRFIYSWDDYDRLRKIPKDLPKQEILRKYLGHSITSTPDIFGCHGSYALHFEREFEKDLPKVGIKPEFIYQTKRYAACRYAGEIKTCLLARDKIKDILNRYREEPLPANWYPLKVYCEKCETDYTEVTSYDSEFSVAYRCRCGHEQKVDFRKNGNVKLVWRVDWPMRWHYEKVDFEPGGKDHSTPGGSRDTGVLIFKAVYNEEPPTYSMYDFVIVKGLGGKMSSSLGNVSTLSDALKVYIPELVRYLFAGTKLNKEFVIPLDEEIIKTYEDFYRSERIYYGKEKISKRERAHWSRVYEMSCVGKPPKSLPAQPSFRHCIELINIYRDVDKALTKLGKSARNRAILTRAKNWVELYAPERYKFEVQKSVRAKLSKTQRAAMHELANKLKVIKTEKQILNVCREVAVRHGLPVHDFFKTAYLVLLNKETGPRLAPLVLAIGKNRVIQLLRKA